ncbi:DUF6011 domain-containing protein [Streptomyces sp. NPDC059524]|uniref:DUF6011 domain-containing protein n=1 Tax=Streptomyces sp. NPDC059524 TaxID=3346856 RepID=UPI00369A3B28
MDRQEPLAQAPSGLRRRVYCRRCRRLLKDPESRARGYGSECDPRARSTHAQHDVDQDPIPGL